MKRIFEIIKKVKLKTIILLIVLLMFNSYAWFIYATRVSMEFNMYVSGWNVEFRVGETVSTTRMLISIDRVFPGMDDYEKTITATNSGEVVATLEYRIISARILDNTYTVGDDLTSEELEAMLKDNYPFTIQITKSADEISALNGEESCTVSMIWPFESGDDAADTELGQAAYQYYAIHPGEPSINIEIELRAEQKSTTNQNVIQQNTL